MKGPTGKEQQLDQGDYKKVKDFDYNTDDKSTEEKSLSDKLVTKQDILASCSFANKDLSQIDVDMEQENDGSWTAVIHLDKEDQNNHMVESSKQFTRDGAVSLNGSQKTETVIKLTDATGWSDEVFKHVEH